MYATVRKMSWGACCAGHRSTRRQRVLPAVRHLFRKNVFDTIHHCTVKHLRLVFAPARRPSTEGLPQVDIIHYGLGSVQV